MNKTKLKRLKNLLAVPTHTWEEDELIQYIVENASDLCDTMEIDDIGNMYLTKGRAEYYPCFVAHLDTVHQKVDMVVEEETLPNAQGDNKSHSKVTFLSGEIIENSISFLRTSSFD